MLPHLIRPHLGRQQPQQALLTQTENLAALGVFLDQAGDHSSQLQVTTRVVQLAQATPASAGVYLLPHSLPTLPAHGHLQAWLWRGQGEPALRRAGEEVEPETVLVVAGHKGDGLALGDGGQGLWVVDCLVYVCLDKYIKHTVACLHPVVPPGHGLVPGVVGGPGGGTGQQDRVTGVRPAVPPDISKYKKQNWAELLHCYG